MPKKNADVHEVVTVMLARQYADYLRTANPIYAWRSIQIARIKSKRGLPMAQLPEWVLDYLEACAKRVQQADGPEAVAAALGMYKKGEHSKRSQALKKNRNDRIVEALLFAREKNGKKKGKRRISDMDIFDAVAERFDISTGRVSDIFGAARKIDKRELTKLQSS